MGSTVQSTNMTPSTWVGGITQGASLAMQAVTSSGAYFQAGDTSQIVILVANASSSDNGAIFIEPGSSLFPGSLGMAYSTTVTLYSTATAPVAVSVPLHGITGSSAIGSTTGSFVAITLMDSNKYKSTSGKIFLSASTGSTKMYAAVYTLPGGSS